MSSYSARADGAGNRAVIPFSFRVAGEQLPAGQYRIEKAFQSRVYYLRNIETGKAAMINLPAGFGANPAKLIFDQDERGYVLQRVR